jgi:integrase
VKTNPTRNQLQWPRKIRVGRVTVPVYRRQAPGGHVCFQVANYAQGKRRLDSYPDEATALEEAGKLARQLSKRNVVAAGMTNAQAADYASAVQTLAPFGVNLSAAVGTLAECLKLVSDLPNIHAAVKSYAARNKKITRKPFADVVSEFLAIKEARRASPRYLEDLRYRLNRMAESFCKEIGNVTTAEVQEWLDRQKFSAQGYGDYRSRLHLLFQFAVARGYAVDNPVAGVERVKLRAGDVEVFTPAEMVRLLIAAPIEFLPCLVIGGFAGLRSAEIERLEWSDIHIVERFIVVGASKAKTAGRRIVPVSDNLVEWLQPYAQQQGNVWQAAHDKFYEAQQDTAKAAGLKWKSNALRHSYASYRFALTNDAGRVAGECGNSAAVIHRHYRELVKKSDAERWFNMKPEAPANVLVIPAKAGL